LAVLYDWLIRPLLAHLGPRDSTLTIVADDDLGGIPFGALFDSRRHRYLVEDVAVRVEASLADAMAVPRERAPIATALFVEAPALDRETLATLGELPAAAEEVRQAMAHYPRATRLSGVSADSVHVMRALTAASIFHFAGHAIFDDQRPEHSRLALRPHGLSTSAIASLDLRKLRLVVLSACETIRAARLRSGGFAGLAEAFRASGAGGIVGALWPIDDRSTSILMASFHSNYAATGDGARALRAAQLSLLHSRDPRLSTPTAWSSFRYTGS
jgi:CHAT domain-containing protein